LVEKRESLVEEFEIVPAISIAPARLKDFYCHAYPDRANFLSQNWKWIYSGVDPTNPTQWPLIAIASSGQLVGHASTIPATFAIDGKKKSGRWFVDFYVSPNFRGRGVGSALIRKIMDSAPILAAIGASQQGRKTFLKHGWSEHSGPTLFSLPINISRHPRFRHSILSPGLKIVDATRRTYYGVRVRNSNSQYGFAPVKDKIPRELYDGIEADFQIGQLHDTCFLEWRIFHSPIRNQIYLYQSDHSIALLGIIKSNDYLRINILKVSGNAPKRFSEDMLKIAIKCQADEIAVVSSIESQKKEFGKVFPIKKPLAFYTYTNSELDMSNFPTATSRWEFIDSDLDLAYSHP